MELFDFCAFQNFLQMLSHDKIIFHMLFRAFHVTPRRTNWEVILEALLVEVRKVLMEEVKFYFFELLNFSLQFIKIFFSILMAPGKNIFWANQFGENDRSWQQ